MLILRFPSTNLTKSSFVSVGPFSFAPCLLVYCPWYLHKDPETNGGLPEVAGSQVSDLFGRHSAKVSNSRAHSTASVTASVPP